MQNEIIENIVYYPNDAVNTDAECPIIPVHDMGDL